MASLDYLPSTRYDAGMATRRPKKMTDQVRQAIDDSGLTRYRIAQDTGIDESTLAKFYHGTRGLSLDNLDLLCVYLGLRIVMDRKPTKKGK
jgi:transcriptional regulator with XRE-family HTH domain